jgi:hypothetical protein
MSYPIAAATSAFPMTIAMLAISVLGMLVYWLLIRPSRTG